MSSAAPSLISEAEFLSLPESAEKLELLDGEVIWAPSPSYRHQWALRLIVRSLEDWAASSKDVTVGMAPLDVRFAPGRILQPDAFVLFKHLPLTHEGPVNDVPELCVEILSSNRAYDPMTKRLVYGEAGVKELWTVSLDGSSERWFGERLSECEATSEQLTSPLLPGYVFDLRALKDG
ncbi:MAG: Uma2 family endonuclease [Polyangiaceae bacterium]